MGQTFKAVAEEIIKKAKIDLAKTGNHEALELDENIKNYLDAMKINAKGKNYNQTAFKSLLKRVEKSKTKLSENSKKVYAKYQPIYKTYLESHKLDAKNPGSLSNFVFLMS